MIKSFSTPTALLIRNLFRAQDLWDNYAATCPYNALRFPMLTRFELSILNQRDADSTDKWNYDDE
jgi:hypothetical protein